MSSQIIQFVKRAEINFYLFCEFHSSINDRYKLETEWNCEKGQEQVDFEWFDYFSSGWSLLGIIRSGLKYWISGLWVAF